MEFVIATRRTHRGDGTTAADIVAKLPEIRILGASNPDTIIVEATPEAANRLREEHGERLMVEGSEPRQPM